MPLLALIAGYIVVFFIGILAALLLWNMAKGRIDLRYVISEEDGSASMSRLQFLIFTFVVSACLLVLTLESGEFPKVGEEIFGLLGVSGGSYVISKGIQKSNEKPSGKTNPAQPLVGDEA